MTHLNHDHCKRENICFLAVLLLLPNLRGSPLITEAVLEGRSLYGIRVLSDLSEPKIRDENMTSVLYKDIGLVKCQCGMKRGPK